MVYIFLDIDGVLVREDPPDSPPPELELDDLERDLLRLDQPCADLFADTVRAHPHARIVIASAWREVFSLDTIKTVFPADIAERIVGMTPLYTEPKPYFRYHEVLDYLKQHQLSEASWVAIDDMRAHYPPHAPLIVTNRYRGFDPHAATQLDTFLRCGQVGN